MYQVSFAAFDDMQLAKERKMQVKVAHFRAEFMRPFDSACTDEDVARVPFYAQDGNDYAIVECCGAEEFYLIGITNGSDGFGDFVVFWSYKTFKEALEALVEITVTDYSE